MGYKSLEDRILGLSEEEKIDIDKVQTAFSEGADPNAVERNGSDRMMDWDTLFGDCVRYNYYEHANLVELLECFLRNGLDVDLLGSLILSAFVCMNNQDMYRLAQIILGRMKAGSAVEDALEKIRMVLFSRTGVTDVAERGQNDLYGLYRLNGVVIFGDRINFHISKLGIAGIIKHQVEYAFEFIKGFFGRALICHYIHDVFFHFRRFDCPDITVCQFRRDKTLILGTIVAYRSSFRTLCCDLVL